MSSSRQSHQRQQADKANRHGLFTKITLFLLALPVTILVTIVFSILVEWGLIFHCNDGPGSWVCRFAKFEAGMGIEHARIMLIDEYHYVNEHFKASLIGSRPAVMAGNLITWFDANVFKPLGIEEYRNKQDLDKGWAWKYLMAAYLMVKVVLLRLCVLFLSLPAYFLFAVVGLVTGLVERDLRKFGAGRESADKFELSTRLITPSIVLCFIFYLSWPSGINPAYIIVPFAAMFGFALHLTARNYKKHF